MSIEDELAALEAKQAAAEAIWAAGKRSFDTGGGAVMVPNYAAKADGQTRGMPVASPVRRDNTGKVVRDGQMVYRVTEDGRKTTLGGQAIIDSKDQRDRHKKFWGLIEG